MQQLSVLWSVRFPTGLIFARILLTRLAIYEIGCFAGAVVMLLVGEKCSRRTWMITGIVVMAVGAAVQTAATKMGHLIAGRIVTGLVSTSQFCLEGKADSPRLG